MIKNVIKADRTFRVSPDRYESKDWIGVHVYNDSAVIPKLAARRGGADHLEALYKKFTGRKMKGSITGFFVPPDETFVANTPKGRCAGLIVLSADGSLETAIHEATHAGHCYASIAHEAIHKSGKLTEEEEYRWFEEALPTCVASIASGIAKILFQVR